MSDFTTNFHKAELQAATGGGAGSTATRPKPTSSSRGGGGGSSSLPTSWVVYGFIILFVILFAAGIIAGVVPAIITQNRLQDTSGGITLGNFLSFLFFLSARASARLGCARYRVLEPEQAARALPVRSKTPPKTGCKGSTIRTLF